jgi:hypothetical protein
LGEAAAIEQAEVQPADTLRWLLLAQRMFSLQHSSWLDGLLLQSVLQPTLSRAISAMLFEAAPVEKCGAADGRSSRLGA